MDEMQQMIRAAEMHGLTACIGTDHRGTEVLCLSMTGGGYEKRLVLPASVVGANIELDSFAVCMDPWAVRSEARRLFRERHGFASENIVELPEEDQLAAYRSLAQADRLADDWWQALTGIAADFDNIAFEQRQILRSA